MPYFEILDQADVARLPSEPFLREDARRRRIYSEEPPHPAEVLGRFLRGDRHRRHVQMTADGLGYHASRHALVRDSVERGTRLALLEREPVEVRGIQAMDRRPSIGAVADITGDLFVA